MTVRRSANVARTGDATALVRLYLLGDFRVSRNDHDIPAELWVSCVAARQLIKTLATAPSRRMHREQMIEYLWPGVEPISGLNRMGKAMHAARHVLEPDLPTRVASSYLSLDGGILSLHRCNVWIDADEFERLAHAALAAGTPVALQAAIDAYTGDVLPDDLYADWATGRRTNIAELCVQVLTALAETREQAGEYRLAISYLRKALSIDEMPEEIHRSLMRLYAFNGERHSAWRQYKQLCAVLERELGAVPDTATRALLTAIQEGSFPHARVPLDRGPLPLPAAISSCPRSPFAGQETVLRDLEEMLNTSIAGKGGIILLEGGPGFGKSRVIRELGLVAAERGISVLWAVAGTENVPYGPFITAIEACVAALPLPERDACARRYPELACLTSALPSSATRPGARNWKQELPVLQAEIVHCLSDVARGGPIVLLLDDLHATDVQTLQTLAYLTRGIADRPWMIVGTYGSGERRDPPFKDLITLVRQIPAGRLIALQPLSREASAVLLKPWLPDGTVRESLMDRLHAFTRGNPLFLEELVRTMLEGRQLRCKAGEWVAYPATFRIPVRIQTLIIERVDRLGEDAAAVLALLSLAGMEVPISFLKHVGYVRESRLLDALGHAIEAGILEEREDRYVFTHSLLRVAIAAGLSHQRRTHLHGLIAQTIERYHPEDAEALGYHRGRAGLTADRLGTFNFAGV